MPRKIKTIISLFGFLILIFSIPFVVNLVQTTRNYLTRAGATNANIVIDTSVVKEPFSQDWRVFSQGGEEFSPNSLASVTNEMRNLSPKYVRIDHLYDFYDVVQKGVNGELVFNFSKLDIVVGHILTMGAKPFFSLSYMPPVLSSDGTIVSFPNSLDNWQLLITKTVEHYSGVSGFNLTDVYYEVWNEPDLFGRFDIGRGKDYLALYTAAARGAKNAQNTNPFFFGGPATTGYYPNWLLTLKNHCQLNNLPFDFFSWHYYGSNIQKLVDSADDAGRLLAGTNIQKIVSEWGIDSENNPAYDNLLGASYTIAVLKNLEGKVNYPFIFEIKDGKDPQNQPFWGRWGLITHETAGKTVKPRFKALEMLSQLKGDSLEVKGGGTFVDGLAVKDGETVRTVLYNYDPGQSHYESAPVTYTNLPRGVYNLTVSSLVSKTPLSETKTVIDGTFSKQVILTPNDVALLELTKTGDLVSFTQGRQIDPSDQSLELVKEEELPKFHLPGEISKDFRLVFWFKPYWSGEDSSINYPLFEIKGAGGQTFFARFGKSGFSNVLFFGLKIGEAENPESSITVPVNNWLVNSWHNLLFAYDSKDLVLTVDGKTEKKTVEIPLLPQISLDFGFGNGAIDDLSFFKGESLILNKSFNGNLE